VDHDLVADLIEDELEPVLRAKAPVLVGLSEHGLCGRLPRAVVDTAAVGRMAAEHLMARGFGQFAVDAKARSAGEAALTRSFVQAVRGAGHERVWVHRDGRDAAAGEDWADAVQWYERVEQLPTPIGVFVGNCYLGQRLIYRCQAAGLTVPGDVAVVAGEDDDTLAHSIWPALSTVDTNPREIGRRAAARLAAIFDGEPVVAEADRVEPIRVVVRGSSNVIAVGDPVVAEAMAFIREHAAEGIEVEDVLDVVPVARRTLERRFTKALGHSPHHYILQARLDLAKQMLVTTKAPIEQIAHATGFASPSHLSMTFRRLTGHRPGEFRARGR